MKIIYIFIFIFVSACSSNVFDEFADKETSEAVFFEAKLRMNEQDYESAVTLFEGLEASDPSFLTVRERVPVHASAYSGRCGLILLDLLNSLQNTGSSTILGILMSALNLADAQDVADCIQAESIIVTNIGDETVRDGDENLFLAFNSLAKVGAILSSLADTDNDDTADAGFDQCDNIDLPEAMVREVGAGIGQALLSLAAVGTSYVDDAVADVQALCDSNPALASFCTSSDPGAFSPAEVQALRYAIGSSDFGINSCGGNNFNDCALANPVCP